MADDAPPPYDNALPNPLTAHLSTHLASLPTLIRASRTAHTQRRLNQDLALTSLLTPPITSLLHAFATRPTPPPLAELTLVPAAAVPPDGAYATPAIDSGRPRRTEEIRRLERVVLDKGVVEELFGDADDDDEKNGGEERGWEEGGRAERRSGEFDDWGRWGEDTDGGPPAPPSHLWFADEALATRLARLLQPASPKPPLPPPAAAAPAPQRELPKARGWGALFKSPDPLEPVRRAPPPQKVTEGVTMSVRAEEVTFRRENEMGIWESRNGFGIVVRVRGR